MIPHDARHPVDGAAERNVIGEIRVRLQGAVCPGGTEDGDDDDCPHNPRRPAATGRAGRRFDDERLIAASEKVDIRSGLRLDGIRLGHESPFRNGLTETLRNLTSVSLDQQVVLPPFAKNSRTEMEQRETRRVLRVRSGR